jgi:Ni/Fe-hydrogenase subunit HybB-like protein
MPVRQLVTPGVLVLLGLALTGLAFGLKRFIFGIGSTTNLDQQHPWGLWIGIDVASGVALAAGGFTSAFLAHVLHRERYHAIARPALLTAMLGYTSRGPGTAGGSGAVLQTSGIHDHVAGQPVLFEVGMCVMYLTVLYLEFVPIACERLMWRRKARRLSRLAKFAYGKLEKVMFVLVIAGARCLPAPVLAGQPHGDRPEQAAPAVVDAVRRCCSAVGHRGGLPMVIWESLWRRGR